MTTETRINQVEIGKIDSYAEINDFKRCRGSNCHWGFFVSATNRTPSVQCPRCGDIQPRD